MFYIFLAAVIGAGVVGTSIAYHLAKRGAQVTVIDQRGPASQASGNTFGVHAEVVVYTADGDVQRRWVRAGGTGYGSASPLEVHFGLGGHASVDRLEVLWPDGEVSAFSDVASKQVVTVRRLE